jgi:hypothetical protein
VSSVSIYFPSHLRLPLGFSLLPTFLSRRNCEFISRSGHANIVDYEENYDDNYRLLGITRNFFSTYSECQFEGYATKNLFSCSN